MRINCYMTDSERNFPAVVLESNKTTLLKNGRAANYSLSGDVKALSSLENVETNKVATH